MLEFQSSHGWMDTIPEEAVIRQFVAMPLGGGVTVEEQLNPKI